MVPRDRSATAPITGGGLHFTPAGVKQVIAPWLIPQLRALVGD